MKEEIYKWWVRRKVRIAKKERKSRKWQQRSKRKKKGRDHHYWNRRIREWRVNGTICKWLVIGEGRRGKQRSEGAGEETEELRGEEMRRSWAGIAGGKKRKGKESEIN